MDLYIWRLARLGFSDARAKEVYWSFIRESNLEELDTHISDLEYCWGE